MLAELQLDLVLLKHRPLQEASNSPYISQSKGAAAFWHFMPNGATIDVKYTLHALIRDWSTHPHAPTRTHQPTNQRAPNDAPNQQTIFFLNEQALGFYLSPRHLQAQHTTRTAQATG
eukprot:GHUV01049585.1.p1 GENE.GHUV01049585.1~~GHUV01049585.1.p1  ORF type:complete len:117 (+),score=24.24 GHUV01049585.1:301-651(+)